MDQLGTRVYGAWLGSAELLAWIQPLDLGIPNLMTQRIGAAYGADDRAVGGRWFATGLVFLLAIASGLAFVGVLGAPVISVWAQVPPTEATRFTACFRVGAVASGLLLLFNGFVSLSRGVQRSTLVNAVLVGGAGAGFAVSVAPLLLGWGLWALPCSPSASRAPACAAPSTWRSTKRL